MLCGQKLETRELPNNVPYVFEDLGSAKLLNYYHKSYFYINITQINLAIIELNFNFKKFATVNPEIKTFHLYKRLNEKITTLETKVTFLQPPRHRRGIFNGLGSIIKAISGNLDDSDLQMIKENLNELRENENTLKTQNSKTLSIVKTITDRFDTNLKIISDNFATTNITLHKLTSHQETYNLIFQEYVQISTLERFLDDLLHSLLIISQQGTNFFLFNPNDLVILEDHLKSLFSLEELIPFQTLTTIEILSLLKLSYIITHTEIIFVTAIPILFKENYRYKNIFPLVFKNNHLLVLPETHILKAKDNLFVKECTVVNNFHLCSHRLSYQCNLETLENCTVVKVNNFCRVSKLLNESLLITLNKPIEIYDNCVNEKYRFHNNIIISSYCNLEINGLYYPSKVTHYNINVPNINFSIEHVNIQLDHVKTLEDVKSEIDKNDVDLKLRNLHWHNASNTVLVLFIISCVSISIFIYRKNIFSHFHKAKNPSIPEEEKDFNPGLHLTELST